MENYEEKYKDLIARLQKAKENDDVCDERYCCVIDEIAPELTESEDEKVRKEIMDFIDTNTIDSDARRNRWFSWLEKQGKQKSIDDLTQQEAMDIAVAKCFEQGEQELEMKSPEESLGIDSATYNKIVDECVYGEKPADKVEPKFKVGDKIRRKTPSSFDKDMQVARIGKDYYLCNHIGKFSSEVVPFSEQSNYELIEQKPWSEEDDDNMMMIEDRLSDYLDYIREDSTLTKHRKNSLKEEVIGYVNWLKSLKDRVQPIHYSDTEKQEMFLRSQRPHFWKPSDEQMEALNDVISSRDIKYDVLSELWNDLKKLKGE